VDRLLRFDPGAAKGEIDEFGDDGLCVLHAKPQQGYLHRQLGARRLALAGAGGGTIVAGTGHKLGEMSLGSSMARVAGGVSASQKPYRRSRRGTCDVSNYSEQQAQTH